MCGDERRLEQDIPQSAPPSGDGPFAAQGTAVVRYGSELGHFGDQHSAGNGADLGIGTQDAGGFDQCVVYRDGLLNPFFQL